MKKIILLPLLLIIFQISFTQDEENKQNKKFNSKFSIGAMTGVGSRLYKTHTHKTPFVPVFGGEVEGLYLLGTEIGYKKQINEKLSLTGFTQIFGGLSLQGIGGALGGAALDNSDMKEGYRGINDRKTQMEYGIRVGYNLNKELKLVGEVRGGEYGGTGKGSIIRPIMVSRRFILIPQLNLTLLNKNISNYYFGVTESEANNSESWKIDNKYEIDRITVATSIGLTGSYYLTRKLSIFALTELQYVGDEISDSPIVDTNINYFVGTGLRYTF